MFFFRCHSSKEYICVCLTCFLFKYPCERQLYLGDGGVFKQLINTDFLQDTICILQYILQ